MRVSGGGAYLALFVGDLALLDEVALVADEDLVDAFLGVLFDLVHPVVDRLEGVPVGHVVDDDDSVGALVVGRGDGFEPLLAGGIPLASQRGTYDLQLHSLALHGDRADLLRAQPPPLTKSTPIVEM